MMKLCDIHDATHVEIGNGHIFKIAGKWGIEPDGWLTPPSRGGFGVILESGERVSMWRAGKYYCEIADGGSLPG